MMVLNFTVELEEHKDSLSTMLDRVEGIVRLNGHEVWRCRVIGDESTVAGLFAEKLSDTIREVESLTDPMNTYDG